MSDVFWDVFQQGHWRYSFADLNNWNEYDRSEVSMTRNVKQAWAGWRMDTAHGTESSTEAQACSQPQFGITDTFKLFHRYCSENDLTILFLS